ncbi:MAG: ribonuclease HI [Candidatus Fonsibacter sp.]|jgi:ribonuclease HI|nr:ribonuclease HI [Pelagibacterales bacterium]
MSEDVIVFTDGSCLGNPGKGGWAILIIEDNSTKEFFGSERTTTNNRMELTAAINAVKKTKSKKKVKIVTDSKYVKNGIETWINNWKKNNWKTSNKQNVKNKDLWIELDTLIQKRNINWSWVKGHANNLYNERVDLLAKNAAEET